MRISCSQCGAGLLVQSRDFFLECPYCNARLLFDLPGRTLMISAPSVGSESIYRLFPGRIFDSVRLLYYPYVEITGAGLVPAFSQPIPELDGYRPPSSSMSVLSEEDASPEQLMPPSEELPEGLVVFHPFLQVTDSTRGIPETFLVDAVSGLPLRPVDCSPDEVPLPSRSFFEVFASLLVFSAAAFLIAGAAGAEIQDMLAASLAASIVGCALMVRFRVLG